MDGPRITNIPVKNLDTVVGTAELGADDRLEIELKHGVAAELRQLVIMGLVSGFELNPSYIAVVPHPRDSTENL